MTLIFRASLPPSELSPNRTRNVHWARKHAAVESYKAECRVLAIDARNRAKWKAPARVRLELLFGLKGKATGRYKPEDPDNAVGSVKALIDSMVAAGLFEDDKWAILELGRVAATREDGPWVEVRLEALG